MKDIQSLMLSLLAVGSLLAPGVAAAREDVVEIPIQKVFVPTRGFDDNDHIELVVRSQLPNNCYNAGMSSLAVDAVTRTIKVRYLAFREMNGPCTAPDSQLEEHNVPFISPVAVGLLEKGSYAVDFAPAMTRSFQVDKAPFDYVDNFHYSSVSAIETDEIFKASENVEVALSGLFSSSCERFASPPVASVVDDVIVILPIMAPIQPSDICLRYLREYKEKISIGQLEPKEYLVHARSREGRASYRLINVLAQ